MEEEKKKPIVKYYWRKKRGYNIYELGIFGEKKKKFNYMKLKEGK